MSRFFVAWRSFIIPFKNWSDKVQLYKKKKKQDFVHRYLQMNFPIHCFIYLQQVFPSHIIYFITTELPSNSFFTHSREFYEHINIFMVVSLYKPKHECYTL